jgi:RNA polymerase sigma-70 factor (ECF subfamily)
LYKAKGKEAALQEAAQLQPGDNHFYYLLMGELYNNLDDQQALQHYEKAKALAKTQPEKQGIQEKINSLTAKNIS